ncbi:TolC family protein [bacterium]|nr:TolC family protein [bacterium]
MNKQKKPLWLIGFYLLSIYAQASEISLEQVLHSASQFHPAMLEQMEKLKQSEQDIQIAKSLFDTKLNFENNYAATGFYDGSYFSTYIEQSLPWSGVDIYGKFRKSTGDFPGYEGNLETLSDGEMSFGIEWSILQSFIKDPRRLALIEAQYKNKIQNQQLQLNKIIFQEMAAKAFFKWKAYAQTYKIYQNLLNLAKNRQDALVKKNKAGDIAKIYLEENQRYIFERERKLLLAQQLMDNSAIYLSFFLRNKNGTAVDTVDSSKLKPKNIDPSLLTFPKASETILNRFPKLSMIEFKQKIIDQNLQFLKVKRLPDLKIKAKYSRDLGDGSQTLAPEELDVSSLFSFPLQNRRNNTKYLQAKSKLRELNHNYTVEKTKLYNEYDQLIVSKNIALEQLNIINKEVAIAEKLALAERVRWENGDSNFLLVNLREQDVANTHIERVKTHLALESLWTKNLKITNGFDQVFDQSVN